MRLSLGLGLVASIFLVSTAWCEDGEASRGRLPDGRAFRTDGDGTQLVDYIAELELNVEALTRQVHGLEDETKAKQAQIDRLEKQKPAQPVMLERDITASATHNTNNTKAASITCPAPELVCAPQVKDLNQQLEAVRADLDVERGLTEKKTNQFQHEIEELKTALDTRGKEVETLRASLSDTQGEASNALAVLENTRKEAEEARVKLAQLNEEQANAQKQQRLAFAVPQERASLSMARSRAVDSVRGKLQTELNQLRGLLNTRDELYRRYSKQKHAVAFTPSKSVSSRGLSPNQIGKQIADAETIGDLSLLSRDIDQIERRLQEDIGLMKRMDRVR